MSMQYNMLASRSGWSLVVNGGDADTLRLRAAQLLRLQALRAWWEGVGVMTVAGDGTG